ncbi:RodZ domain-containing protein [Streptomyces sp. NPDC020096]
MSIGNSPSDAGSEAPLSIGRALHRARLDAGLTVEEISAATRVRAPIVHAIEQDDFSRCGGDVYARGHIRTLARAVGLDPAPLIESYDGEHGGKPSPTHVAPVYEAERIRPEPRRPNWTAAMVAAIVIVVGFVGFTMFSGARSGSESVAGNASQAHPSAPQPSHTPAKRPEPSRSAIAAAPADKVTVKLTADGGKSWITATANDGHSLFEGLLDQGQSKTFTDDKKISLVLGNAGAVKMFVNGKDLGTAGSDGQLIRTNFTPGNPQAG